MSSSKITHHGSSLVVLVSPPRLNAIGFRDMVVVVIALIHIKLPQACANPISPALWQPPGRQGIIFDWSSRPTDDRSFSKSRHSGLTMRAALPNHSRWRLLVCCVDVLDRREAGPPGLRLNPANLVPVERVRTLASHRNTRAAIGARLLHQVPDCDRAN